MCPETFYLSITVERVYCTCVVVLWHISAVLCEMVSVTRIMTDGWVELDLLHGPHARSPDLNRMDF
jgi:hypothetical protein